MRFDISDLRLFEAVVRAGSISAGAEAAHMALASASARVSGMEAALGTKLLFRDRRGVTPTAAGRTLLQHARTILAQVDKMRRALRAFGAGLKGEMRLLSNTAGLVEVLPAALRVFLEANPDIDIDIEEKTSVKIVAAIRAGDADFGVTADNADPHGLEVRPLGIDRLTVITSARGALSVRQDIAFADLLDEPFVGLTDGALSDHLALQAARLGKRVNYRVRLRSFDAVARLVEAGIGVGVVPLATAERYRQIGLAVVRLSDVWANRRLVVCARSFAAMSPPARLFVDEIERASAGRRSE